ncbi:hypothetical protein I2I05_03500 [Hymenobacter sp. BT683]|uniref:Glycosyltransferase RgtA/B/C/D-like domain-containing protein n=1 Tax=Hymenobacter jeongseonensis TaxID=2791027 RepID=A0ABS0IER5_9BACT|nr:hypothetical protein [Hymenobacter jeongseonensis]MBF9236453.1 hypothetical protein [Hymenobacter jeongseonensis]
MRTIIFPRGVYYAAVAVLVALLLSTLPQRAAHFDDAWGAELAYWVVKDGHARSELFRGIGDGSEQHAYVFHKAFIYVEAGLMSVFGFGLYTVKMVGLLFSLVGMGLLLRYFRGQAEASWLAVFLYLGCGALVSAAFIGRPEPLAMSAGLASFMLLRAARGRPGFLALAGLLGGLAGLAHLHALIYLMAGGLWLLLQRTRLPGVLAFGAAGTVTMALYPLDAVLNHELPVLLSQFSNAAVTQANQDGWAKLAMLLKYQAVYFHSEGEAVLTVLLLALVALTWRRGAGRLTGPQQYLLLLVLSFWIICARATGYYFLLLMPFFIIVVVELALGAWPRLAPWRRVALQVLLVVYPVGAGVRAHYLWRTKQETPWPATENAQLARYMPKRGTVAVVPLDFFFNEVGNYRLRGLTGYAMRNTRHYHDTLSVHGFFALVARDSAEYVVTDHSYNQGFRVPPTAPSRIGAYERVFQNPWHSVYRRVAH